MIKLFTICSEQRSAEKLGFPTFTYSGYNVNEFNNDVVLRWGNSMYLCNSENRVQEFKNVINHSKSIHLNCQKLNALKALSTVVKTPTIFEKVVPKRQLSVIRPHTHTGGSGFSVKRGPYVIDNSVYATQYLKTNIEYRVWYINGQTLMARRITSNKTRLKEKYPCRSLWSYKFYKAVPKQLHDQVCKAFAKIGLVSGAADVLKYRKKYYFLELNSAPTIDNSRLVDFFSKNIKLIAKQMFPDLVT
jgi:hypothetical protein